MPRNRPKPYDRGTLVRRMARRKVGAVPPARLIEPEPRRSKPKHKKKLIEESSA